MLPLLFFLLPMQMKSDAFSVLKLPLRARRRVESSPSVQALAGRRRALRWHQHPPTGLRVGGTRACPRLGPQG